AASAVASRSSCSVVGVRSVSPPVSSGAGSSWDVAVGQGIRTTRSPGWLNEVTILVRMGAGQVASGSTGVGPHAQTVAGIGPIGVVRGRLAVPARGAPRRGEEARAGALG